MLLNVVGNALIGGTGACEANTIANNGGEGVRLDPLGSFAGVRIAGNSIFNNTRLGIDHYIDNDPATGVTPNDADDLDGRHRRR